MRVRKENMGRERHGRCRKGHIRALPKAPQPFPSGVRKTVALAVETGEGAASSCLSSLSMPLRCLQELVGEEGRMQFSIGVGSKELLPPADS